METRTKQRTELVVEQSSGPGPGPGPGPETDSAPPPPPPTLSMLGAAAAAMRERRHQVRTVVIPAWIRRLTAVASRMMTKRTWVATVFLLGSLDAAIGILHLVQTSDSELAYSLIVGPPPVPFWAPLCFFTVLRTALYFPESANTLSALRSSDGGTLAPLHVEMTLSMSVAHIPLAFADFLLIRCWRLRSTDITFLVHVTRLAFLSLRLSWYAHIEGKKFRKNDKHEIPQIMVMICCVLLAILTSVPVSIMRLKHESVMESDLRSASVFIVHSSGSQSASNSGVLPSQRYADGLDCVFGLCSKVPAKSSSGDTKCVDRTDLNAFATKGRWKMLVESVLKLYEMSPERIAAEYECKGDRESRLSPTECYSDSADDKTDDKADNKADDKADDKDDEEGAKCTILFRFSFRSSSETSPFGQIAYNYARRCNSRRSGGCRSFSSEMVDGWHLVFYQVNVPAQRNNVTLAFRRAYVQPKLKYDSSIDACSAEDDDDKSLAVTSISKHENE